LSYTAVDHSAVGIAAAAVGTAGAVDTGTDCSAVENAEVQSISEFKYNLI